MSMHALFGDLAVFLSEGKWDTPGQLAEALADFFRNTDPIPLKGPLELSRARDFPPIRVVDKENFFEQGIQFQNRGDTLAEYAPSRFQYTKTIHQHSDDSVTATKKNYVNTTVFYPGVTRTPVTTRRPVIDPEIVGAARRSQNWDRNRTGFESDPNESGGGLGPTGGLPGLGMGSGGGSATVVTAITGVTINSDCSVTVNYSTTEIGEVGSVATVPGLAGDHGADIMLLAGC